MSDTDTLPRLNNINNYFLRGLLNTDLFTIDINDFNTDFNDKVTADADKLKEYASIASTDITDKFYTAESPYNNVLDMSAHVKNVISSPSNFVKVGSATSNALVHYKDVISKCLRDGETVPDHPTEKEPLKRKFVSYGGASNVACPLFSKTTTFVDSSATGRADDWLEGNTYHNTNPVDVANSAQPAAHKRMAEVTNTYTLKRVALYYVLLANATVLAYAKIMATKIPIDRPAVMIDPLFKLTMQQFVEFNNLYNMGATGIEHVPVVPTKAATWTATSSGSVSIATGGVTTSGNNNIALPGNSATAGLGGAGWATDAGNVLLPAYAVAMPATTVAKSPLAVIITPWATGEHKTLARPLVFAYDATLTATSSIGADAKLTFNVSPTANPALQNPTQSAVTWAGAPMAFPLTSTTAATIIVTDGDATSSSSADVGFKQLSFPNPSPAPFYEKPPGGGYNCVWAGSDDLAFTAQNAVGTSATGWATPAAMLDPSDATHSTVIPTPKSRAYWACQLTVAEIIASYTVTPFPDGRFAPAGWQIYTAVPGYSQWIITADNCDDPNLGFGVKGGEVMATATTTTYALTGPGVGGVNAFKIAPFRIDPATGTRVYGGVGFLSITLNIKQDGRTDSPTLDVMGTMDAHERGYQSGVATLNRDEDAFKRERKRAERAARLSASADAEARQARWLLLAVLAVTAAAAGASAAAVALNLDNRRAVLAGALVAAVLAAIAVAALARE